MNAPNLNYLWTQALLDELVKGGVRHAVVCPGSRSSPLAVSCAQSEALRTWSVIDERSAGFFALGLARSSGAPVALIATSGSAGAHFLPAAIEASMSGVPLVLLTADRPWELQGFGAPQTIPQQGLFGAFAKVAEQLSLPEPTDSAFAHLRAVVARAVASALRPPRSAVHLNIPFREPLAPVEGPLPGLSGIPVAGRGASPYILSTAPSREVNAQALESLARRIVGARRGLVVCGPRGDEDGFGAAVHRLAERAGFPVIAEASSQARFGFDRAVAHADLILADPTAAAELRPELVLRFGGGLTSKRLQNWLDGSGAHTILFSDEGHLFDPAHAATEVVEADPVATLRSLEQKVGDGAAPASRPYAGAWGEAEARARAALEAAFAESDRLTEPRIAHEVVASLAEGSNLFVSSSMPIREVDAFAASGRSSLRVFCNRGANGIDGIVSTALGVSAASKRPTVLLTGDVAFLHDLGGLLTAHREGVPLTVVVVNNDGGGIFSFLPIAGTTPHFEKIFGTPHGLDLSHAARLFGATFSRPSTPAELVQALGSAREGGLHLIEVRVERGINPEVHKALAGRVSSALRGGIAR